jgi:hypothetical protein
MLIVKFFWGLILGIAIGLLATVLWFVQRFVFTLCVLQENAVDHELYDGKLNQINSYDNNCDRGFFGCSIYDIVCYANTFKVVVFFWLLSMVLIKGISV